jgi:hypothetical protein
MCPCSYSCTHMRRAADRPTLQQSQRMCNRQHFLNPCNAAQRHDNSTVQTVHNNPSDCSTTAAAAAPHPKTTPGVRMWYHQRLLPPLLLVLW